MDDNDIQTEERMNESHEEDRQISRPKRGRPAQRDARRGLTDNTRHMSRRENIKPNRDIDKAISRKKGDFSKPSLYRGRQFYFPKSAYERFKRQGYHIEFVRMDDDSTLNLYESVGFVFIQLSEVPEFGASVIRSSSAHYNSFKDCCVCGDQVAMKILKEDYDEAIKEFLIQRNKHQHQIKKALETTEELMATGGTRRISSFTVEGPEE